jgi:membrane associated rhomboid family serine protease
MGNDNNIRRVRWGAGSGGGPGDGIKILLMLNVIGFLAQLIWGGFITYNLGLVPYLAWSRLRVWQFVTYLFLHGDFFHILFNMYALWMFGSELESEWGFKPFLRYYFICGIGAGLFHTLITPHSLVPTIGASGAVSGVMTAYALMYPERELQLLLFFIIPVRMKAKVMAIGLAVISLLFGAMGSPDGIAHFAHLGGMAVGAAYFMLVRRGYSPIGGFAEWRRKRRFKLAGRMRAAEDEMTESVNAVLDRANEVGFDRLTKNEKKILQNASDAVKKRLKKQDR